MSVLVDSSVWVHYLRGDARNDDRLDWLIDEGLVVTNDLILAELLPPLIVRREGKLVSLLREIPTLPLDLDWPGLVADQVACLRNGINKVGLSDLIIAQNARRNAVPLFSHDKHFRLMSRLLGLEVF
jgi:predicted nucleic acid-binding protein